MQDQELVDDVYETAKAELPWYYRLIAKIFPPKNMIDKVKLCLSTRSDYVRYWPCPFPLLGSHITFYASDEKLDTIHRWPSVRPQYIDEKILEKIS